MTLEEQIFALLGPLVGGRVFPDMAPVETPKPYVTYQVIPGASTRWLDGTAADKVRSTVQINVWGARRLSVNATARAIRDAMCTPRAVTDTTFFATPETDLPKPDHNDIELPDAPQGLFGTIQDFNVISKE
ncbi:MAG: DUF3168 domain-containing protein [Rubrivivax sp.]|nr:MAG: DUF3168 domain-containing protein [Rubrivivax sp.]